ncbi:MAG: hypothetical protein RG741_05005 [Bacteroidales bacterium]|nr:hypothetical protein [Bacteroidales bacterium]
MAKADLLFAEGNYFEAAIAYERIIFLSESPEVRVRANLTKAEALKQSGMFDKARKDLQRSLSYRGNDSLRLEVLYQFAFCSYMAGHSAEARSALLQVSHLFDPEPQHRLYLLESLVLADLEQWDELRSSLMSWFMAFSQDVPAMEAVLTEYDQLLKHKLFREDRTAERARLWSTFIPGSGQLYAGEASWGILNAFSQLAGLGGFALMAANGYWIAGSVIGLGAFQSFYFGGIKQAGELADAANKSRLDEFQTALNDLILEVATMLSN